MKNDLKLVVGNDTLGCKLFNFSRDFNLSPKLDFTFGFEANMNAPNEELKLLWDDGVFQTGTAAFAVSANALDQLPNLALTNN